MTAQPRTSNAIGAAPTPAESSAAESPAAGSSVAESPLAESPAAAPLPASSPPAPREKTGIPRNPGRRELGMKATLLFPDRDIVQRFYVPLIYTACRTCYSELEPGEIFRRALAGEVATDKQPKLIRSAIESGHGSTIAHLVFTFRI